MSGAPVDPADVPVFTGDLDVLEAKTKALSRGGSKVQTAGSDVHKSFGGLAAFYKAPEAEQLFGVTKPVERTAHDLSDDMHVIAGALGTYAREIRPLIHRLQRLKQEAADFRDNEAAEDDWSEDGDLTEENLNRRNKIAEVWAAFQEAERDCHAKIVALVGGKALHTIDASHKKGYGYDAEALKASKSLPWGDAVEESVPWWQVWEHAYDFGKGFIVDGVGGTIDGIYTLFGGHGGDAAGQAWLGLAKLSTAVAITTTPGLNVAYWMTPGKMLPSWLRDSRTAVLDTGKALVAWDQWESNGSRAAGAVTFNIVTAVFTRGGGAAVQGAGKAGALAKGLSVVSKVGSAVDPMTYAIKGAGAGLSKVGDVMAHLKGLGHVEIPKISDGAYSLPEGAVEMPNGTIQLPKDAVIPEGATKLPDGSIKLPEDTVTLPPNTVKDPFTGNYTDAAGHLYSKDDGSLLQDAKDAPQGKAAQPATGADNPRIETPAHQEQRVPAGVGGRGDDATRLGSDISDPSRTGDMAGHDSTRPGDNTPTGRTEDHGAPGGNAGNHMPTNNLDNTPTRGGTRPGDTTPTTGGGHTDTPSTGSGGRDHPGGPSADNGLPGGSGHRETPGTGRFDDATTPGNRSNDGHDGGHHGNGGERELTAEERKARQDELIRKANEDPAWRKEHYDELGRRKSADEVVDGVELPQVTKGPDGKLIAKYDMPSGPSETKYGAKPLGLDTVPDGNLPELNKAAANRKVSVDLTNAAKAFEETPSPETKAALKTAQEAYTKQLGDLPNNSKISEKLGEQAAALHVVPHEFHGAEIIDDLPQTPNGANMFDQVYKVDGDGYLIVEAKAPSGDLDWRHGRGDPDPANPHLDDGGAQGMRVKQGTRVYVRTILAEMQKRGGRDAEIAADLRKALREGKLQYVLVKANNPIGSSYAGAKLDYLKIQP